tara:strand:+ start:9188 stop:9517 length:330 start_codon:yes stop_codon:yes gene_type:complete
MLLALGKDNTEAIRKAATDGATTIQTDVHDQLFAALDKGPNGITPALLRGLTADAGNLEQLTQAESRLSFFLTYFDNGGKAPRAPKKGRYDGTVDENDPIPTARRYGEW